MEETDNKLLLVRQLDFLGQNNTKEKKNTSVHAYIHKVGWGQTETDIETEIETEKERILW